MAIFAGVVLIYWFRLFQLQILDERYTIDARSNAIRHKVQYPGRGLILDRDGRILVYNEAVYDLMVVPGQVDADSVDWNLLARLIEVDSAGVRERYRKARAYSRYAPSVFEKQISKEVYPFFRFLCAEPQPATLFAACGSSCAWRCRRGECGRNPGKPWVQPR